MKCNTLESSAKESCLTESNSCRDRDRLCIDKNIHCWYIGRWGRLADLPHFEQLSRKAEDSSTHLEAVQLQLHLPWCSHHLSLNGPMLKKHLNWVLSTWGQMWLTSVGEYLQRPPTCCMYLDSLEVHPSRLGPRSYISEIVSDPSGHQSLKRGLL